MSIYVLIGLDGDGELTALGIYEDKDRAEQELRQIRANWMKEANVLGGYAKSHADALRIQELKKGFGEYNFY